MTQKRVCGLVSLLASYRRQTLAVICALREAPKLGISFVAAISVCLCVCVCVYLCMYCTNS